MAFWAKATTVYRYPSTSTSANGNITNGDCKNPDVSNGGRLSMLRIHLAVLYCIMNSHFNPLQLTSERLEPLLTAPSDGRGVITISAVPME